MAIENITTVEYKEHSIVLSIISVRMRFVSRWLWAPGPINHVVLLHIGFHFLFSFDLYIHDTPSVTKTT